MNRLPETELMRLLHGELPPERAFELHERLSREPELAAELRRLEATWDRLELPPAAPAPRGFAREVAARAERARADGLWSVAPTRVRVGGLALLAAGLALGVGLASGLSRWGLDAAGSGGTAVVAAAPEASAGVPLAPDAPRQAPAVAPNGGSIGEPAGGTAGGSVGGRQEGDDPTRSSAGGSATGSGSNRGGSTAASGQVAELDYDLPSDLSSDGGAFGDEGTLADDFWQAFDGSEGSAASDASDLGMGSEIL